MVLPGDGMPILSFLISSYKLERFINRYLFSIIRNKGDNN